MTPRSIWTGLRQWGPFALRTAAYGTYSCLIGPLTPQRRASLWAMRQWCISSCEALLIDVEVTGAEDVPADAAFVYACNHQSIVDVIVLGAALPGDYKWAAKRSLMNVPFLGWHLRLAGHVAVERGGGAAAADRVIDRFVSVLGRDKPLLIFPEGTRTPDGDVKNFRKGGFIAAVRGGAPVIPVALDGTWQMMAKGDFSTGQMRRKPVTVRIGKPIDIPTHGDEESRVAALRDAAHEAVLRLLQEGRAQNAGPTSPETVTASSVPA